MNVGFLFAHMATGLHHGHRPGCCFFVRCRCKVMDMRLGELAPRHLETKFLRIDAEKAPFFVQKLQVCVYVAGGRRVFFSTRATRTFIVALFCVTEDAEDFCLERRGNV